MLPDEPGNIMAAFIRIPRPAPARQTTLFLMLRILSDKMYGTDDPFIDPGSVFLGIKLFIDHLPAVFCSDIVTWKSVQADGDNIVPALLAIAESLVIRAHHQHIDKRRNDLFHYIDITKVHDASLPIDVLS
jgi:hypothetical protein